MIVVFHVTIALLSVLCAAYGYVKPTQIKVKANYALMVLTLASGFSLVWSEPAQMLHVCMVGVAYLIVVSVGILMAGRKLAALDSEQI